MKSGITGDVDSEETVIGKLGYNPEIDENQKY
jgi:hypothetical protein